MNKSPQERMWKAVRENKTHTIKKLLRQGLSPNISNDDGWTPLHIAVLRGASETVELLLSARADPNLMTEEGSCALYMAVRQDHLSILKLLLQSGANAKATGELALLRAVQKDREEAVRLLLDAGASPDAHDEIHGALSSAIRAKNAPMAYALLEAGADPNGSGRHSALEAAIATGQNEIFEALVRAGADPKRSNQYGDQPIHTAAAYGEVKALNTLLELGAPLEAQEERKRFTPLLEAARAGQDAAVTLLLERGASVSALSSDGFDAHTLALMGDHSATAALLKKAGCLAQPEFKEQIEEAAQEVKKANVALEDRENARKRLQENGRKGKVISGPFKGFEAVATKLNSGKLQALILLFGRETEVELSREQFAPSEKASPED